MPIITTNIKCQMYEPMVGKVKYIAEKIGIPMKTDPETEAEMGWRYTVASSLSPYVIGWKNWKTLCDIAGDRHLSDVFRAEVDFEKNTIAIYQELK